MKFKENIVTINGRKVFYLEKNGKHKKAMVFLHGFPGNHEGLLDMAGDLGEMEYRLIIPDLPACGFSDALNTEHNLKNYSQWLNDFLESLAADEVILVGHSFGARISLVFADSYHRKAKHLVLITPVVRVEGFLGRLVSIYYEMAEVLPKYLQKMVMSNGFGKKMGDLIIFKSSSKKVRQRIIDRDIREIKKTNPRVCNELFDELRQSQIISLVKNIHNKSLIIAGGLDQIAPLDSIEELVSQLPNAKLEIIKNGGHLVPLERPRATANIIKKWLQGVTF